jgi:hypothetical protein
VGGVYKIVAKVLANRLKMVVEKMVVEKMVAKVLANSPITLTPFKA